jgi:S-adenosylmethionine:tRNA ribosyltransferase-isomerase
VRTRDFSFELPEELIAQHPADRREEARLLILDRASRSRRHDLVAQLPRYLEPGTVLVFNDTRVRKARFVAERRETGGAAEFLLVEQVNGHRWWAITNRGKRARVGSVYSFPENRSARVVDEEDGRRLLEFDAPVADDYLERNGAVPLPPYIRRSADARDAERYQTVYAKTIGSVAAPTAGLHFTEDLLGRLTDAGIETRFLTLHVGLGTFAPVRTEHVEDHDMHAEHFEVPAETAEAVNRARAEGRRVVAVGTTSVRSLESAAAEDGTVRPGTRETSIFIYPGCRFRAIDGLFTNFHTPESTLIMLVAAFAGRELILETYREAVERRYRFFSYGDAMLIL